MRWGAILVAQCCPPIARDGARCWLELYICNWALDRVVPLRGFFHSDLGPSNFVYSFSIYLLIQWPVLPYGGWSAVGIMAHGPIGISGTDCYSVRYVTTTKFSTRTRTKFSFIGGFVTFLRETCETPHSKIYSKRTSPPWTLRDGPLHGGGLGASERMWHWS